MEFSGSLFVGSHFVSIIVDGARKMSRGESFENQQAGLKALIENNVPSVLVFKSDKFVKQFEGDMFLQAHR